MASTRNPQDKIRQMKNETKELIGFNVPIIGVVETLKEAVEAAGSEENVLADYVSNVLAHSHYAVLRRAIVGVLVTSTGIKRKTKTVGEGEKAKEVIDETEGEYVARLETELGEDALKQFEGAVAEACGKIKVDYTVGTRGSTTPAKKWLAAIDDLKAQGKFDAFCAKFEIDQSQDEESVKCAAANKLKDLVNEQMKSAMKSVTAL